jgi:hypothetical protein
MADNTIVENTTEEFLVPLQIWLPLAVGLAVVGGVAAWVAAASVDFGEGAAAATKLVPFTLTVAGILLGAGLGLLLADIRITKTTKTTTSMTAVGGAEGTGPADVMSKSLEVLKDLSAGKALMVLGVALVVVAMWTVNGGG